MKIAEGIHSLTQEKGGHVHAFLLDDGEGLTLIDSLFDTDAKLILDEIRAMGREPKDLRRILHSHAHRSHIGSTAALKELTGAPVYAHEWEAGIIDGSRKATKVGFWPKPPREAYKLQFALALGLGKHPPCRVDQTMKDGDTVGPVTVLATPGHTPGCLSFWWAERKALFVGDVVVSWPQVEAGWEGLTLDYRENLRSVGKLAEVGEPLLIGVGHGAPILRDAPEVLRRLSS